MCGVPFGTFKVINVFKKLDKATLFVTCFKNLQIETIENQSTSTRCLAANAKCFNQAPFYLTLKLMR